MTPFKVGFFLALRQIRRSNPWTTLLIIFVMMLTFLNLVVISGVLVGLIAGSEEAFRYRYAGDVIVSKLIEKPYIERTTELLSAIEQSSGLKEYTVRYLQSGTVETGYKDTIKKDNEVRVAAGGQFAGIDPEKEERMFHLSGYVVEGEYLNNSDYDMIMLGANLLYKYTPIDSPSFRPLRNVEPGTKVRVRIGDITREMTVKGIVKTKSGELDQRIYINAAQLRQMIGRNDFNVNEISILLNETVTPEIFRDNLIAQGFDRYANIQVWSQAIPQFLDQIKTTFGILGNLIGGIGLIVASITIFIVIFVNIVTRRKFIGILKGIGISPETIEVSYVFQSIFYAVIGSFLGMLVVFLVLQPFIAAHPINFPFSDGILVATISGTFIRAFVLLIATLLAGYIPARLIVRKNTLDAILGR